MSLAKAAVLVELNISSWSGRKLDRKVSAETNAAKGAAKDAARVNKNLFAGSDKLERINNFVSMVRKEYHGMTLPWSTSGARLLPFTQIFEFRDWVSHKEREFDDMVQQFLSEYISLVSAQARQLGDMFDVSDYPRTGELKTRFKFAHTLLPIPEVGDFRIEVEDELRKELEAQYEKSYIERTKLATNDLWERLHETITHLRDKCAAEKTVFRESTLENALELCGVLTKLNVTQNPTLEARRKDLEKALCGVNTEGLRKDEGVRKDTRAKMDALLDKMEGVGLC